MNEAIANSSESLSALLGDLREAWGKAKWLKVKWSTGKPRTIDQNAHSHVWYEQIASELREDDALGVKCFCKLQFGVPILRAEDEEFRAFYDASIKSSLSYEQKLTAMKFLPVTSLMTRAQLRRYCETMQEHYQERGVILEWPKNGGEQ